MQVIEEEQLNLLMLINIHLDLMLFFKFVLIKDHLLKILN
jgi:hypothetical protein